ncbi:MAG: hypothetical protein ACREP9_18870, partial [Candidatus Dormibacteraceae bacterium]
LQSACYQDERFGPGVECLQEISPCPFSPDASMAGCVSDAGLSAACAAALIRQAQIAFGDAG